MDASGFDALILTQEEAVRYLSGYNSVVWAVGPLAADGARRHPRPAPTPMLFGSVFDGGCAAGTAWTADRRLHRDGASCPRWSPRTWRDSACRPNAVGVEYGPGSVMNVPQFIAAGSCCGCASDPGPRRRAARSCTRCGW